MSTKICPSCGETKPIEDFRWKNKKHGLRISYCSVCDRTRRARRYAEQKTSILESNKKSQARRRDQLATGGLLLPDTRRCIDCLQVKPSDDFRWRNKALGWKASRCTVCDTAWRADKYDENKPSFIERNKRQYRKLRAILDEAKSGPCLDCGRSYPPYVMDFDHRDPKTKVAKVSTMVYKGSESLLRAEIAKCDLVCANCHRIRTHRETTS